MLNSWRSYLLAILTTVTVLVSEGHIMTAFGLGMFVFVLVDFVEKLGNTIPILEAMLLISCLQWIVGPYIDYVTAYKHYKYYMYVPEEMYMNLAVPALFFFALPVYYFSAQIDYSVYLRRIFSIKISDGVALNLVAAGFLSDLVDRFAPLSLSFVFYLASGIKFVGLLYLFYSDSKKKWIVFGVVFFSQLLGAVGGGLFHGLLLWSVFTMIFILVFYRFSFAKKSLLLLLGFTGIFILQSVKAEFREMTWVHSYGGNKLELFSTLISEKLENIMTGKEKKARIKFFNSKEDEISEANNRLNQGWIISKIMERIPAKTPYLEGETIKEAIYSSLVPRFLVESKAAGGGGKLTYEKLTGFHLSGTSMGTGILGEAYGNYGVAGTYLFMFLWGLFLGVFIIFLAKRSKVIYSLPLWLSIIFLQVIKAETDMFTVLNHLVKSTIFVFGILYVARQFFKIRL
jgi:hypothetical protein